MIHARKDYDPIQDPRPDGIGEDEPVFLLRAKDIVAPATLRFWADEAMRFGVDPNVCAAVYEWAFVMVKWQAKNGNKVPDVPDGMLRDGR